MDDYPYANLDFQGDLDLALPPAMTWGDIGNKCFLFYEFYDFSNMKMNLKNIFDGIQMTNVMIIF